jgi:hypothetical protein
MFGVSSTTLLIVKLSHYMPWRHLGERRYSSYSFLTSALDGGEWSAWCPSHAFFNPGEKTPSTYWIGGWVGPRASLDAEVPVNILCPCWGSNPSRPACSQTLYWLSYPSSYWVLSTIEKQPHLLLQKICHEHSNEQKYMCCWKPVT